MPEPPAVAGARPEAVPHQPEQRAQALLQVARVRVGGRGEIGQLRVPQALQAVPLAVGLGIDRGVAQFRPGLDVEQEQQPVHVAQAFQPELFGELGGILGRLPQVLFQGADRLVSQQLDGFAQRVLQIPRHAERVPVAVLVQRVQQRGAGIRHEGLPVQQCRRHLEGLGLTPPEDLAPVEPQQTPLRPLAPL